MTRLSLCGAGPGPAQEGSALDIRDLLAAGTGARDLAAEQEALSELGLSSLGHSESHVLATLDAVIAALAALAVAGTVHRRVASARAQLEARRDEIFGPDPLGVSTRILVTLPSEAAAAPVLVAGLIEAGAAAVRINCAHEGPAAWRAMAADTAAAARRAGRRVPALMDLAGPKLRTLALAVPKAVARRESKKQRKALKAAGIGPAERGAKLMRGDRIVLARAPPAKAREVTATLSHPELLGQIRPGALVWFDDGKISARVLLQDGAQALLEVAHVPAGGARLAPEKGVNLPGVAVEIAALTAADLAAPDVVGELADIVGFSFVQTARDLRALQAALAERLAPGGGRPPALLLKIETDLAVRNLPRLIVQPGGQGPVAVRIARGDLAVEIGLERLSEIQEKILWLCEAAAVPVVWATQVLEGLVRKGHASRAEATDAAMGQRAECVMLNKGP